MKDRLLHLVGWTSHCRGAIAPALSLALALSCSNNINTSSRITGESSDATRVEPFSSDGASDPAPTSGAYLTDIGSQMSTTRSQSGDQVLTFRAPDGTVQYSGNTAVIKMSAAIVDADSLALALKTRVGKPLAIKPLAYQIFSPNARGGYESSIPFSKPGLLIIQIGGSLSGVQLVTPPIAMLKNPLSESPSTLLGEKAVPDIEGHVTTFIKNLAALNRGAQSAGIVNSASLLEGTSRPSTLAVGSGFTVFIGDSGRVFSFGSNSLDGNETTSGNNITGRLGSLETSRPIATPILCTANCSDDNPFQINSKARAEQVVAGANHACALFGGKAWCWGSNHFGQIGSVIGLADDRPRVPMKVLMPEGITITSISAGTNHTCAVAMNGQAYCWGQNNMEQSNPHPGACSTGTTPPSIPCAYVPTPMPIPDPKPEAQLPIPPHLMFTRVGAGKDFSCGISNGKIWCWGAGNSGKLGVVLAAGSQDVAATGYPVGPLSLHNTEASRTEIGSFQSLSLGVDHACAIATDQKPYCWGNNSAWQTGSNGLFAGGAIAVRVEAPFDTVNGLRVEARGSSSYGIDSNGRAWAWGSNSSFRLACSPTCFTQVAPSDRLQLGREELDFNGVTPYQPAFVEVSTTPDDSIETASCGRVMGGDIFCWGQTAFLGYGGSIPIAMSEMGRIHRIKMPE